MEIDTCNPKSLDFSDDIPIIYSNVFVNPLCWAKKSTAGAVLFSGMLAYCVPAEMDTAV